MADTASSPGVIVTFYSYKGGTGRSMVLANIAWLAGQRSAGEHEKVLMIDWDLEAPGLHRYFPESESLENADRPGLIDYFTRLAQSLDDEIYQSLSGPEGWRILETLFPLEEYIVPAVAQGVDLIKAGRFGPEYIDQISSFQWADFFRRYPRVYRAFAEYLTAKYQWCFIDSRTGLSDVSGVCTMLMPEKLVTVFTPNRQSLEGVVELASKAIEYRRHSEDPRPLSVFPLPSRIVTEEHKLLQAATDKYRTRFEDCLRVSYELEECDLGPYFQEVAIPHKGFYGFHEMVAVRDDPSASDALSINRAYERFFLHLTTLDSAMESMPGGVETEAPPEPKVGVPSAGSALLKDIGFENDILISYAHIDDVPLGEGEGFVSRLHKDLSVRLAQLLGRNVKIWRDPKLQGNDTSSDYGRTAIERTAVLLAVVSPRYSASIWCRSELEDFVRVAESQGGLQMGKRPRLFRVSNTPVREDTLPEVLRLLLGYEFYRVNVDGRARELRSEADPDTQYGYFSRLDDLAHDIASTLLAMQGATEPEVASSGRVYLAETGSDVRGVRDQLRRELTARGHQVLPDKPLPLTSEELIRYVQEELVKAQLSIHLIGAKSGIIPEGEARSIVELQLDLALQQTGLERVVWAPPELTVSEPFGRILDIAEGEENTDILRTSVEEMKSLVLDKLARRPKKLQQTNLQKTLIYLIYRFEDESLARQIGDYLFDSGVDVALPLFEGDPTEIRLDHEETLRTCDGVLVFWGSGSEAWIRKICRDLRKISSPKPRPAAFYIAPPLILAKEHFRTVEGAVIRDASLSAFDLLLEQIRRGEMA
jgi:MinD-like ATPase involved in chromosome partitioning or flagellar assembly